jgi:uncharacterized protein involved in exopolysaccharide biosynthesis
MSDQASREGATEADAPRSKAENDLLDLVIVLAKHKRLVLGVPFLAAVAAAIYSLLLPNVFTATTRILPPQQTSSAATAMLAQLGGLAALVGAAGGIRSPSDVYVAMLKSRTIADRMIERFDLKQLYEQELQSVTRKVLEGNTVISAGSKDGIITIDVDDKVPQRAADIANAYVDELMKLTRVLAVTEASQRRLFFERQLLLAKDNLVAAEVAARQGLEKGGIAQVDAQGRSLIEVTARLRAQISVKEVQIGAMRTFAAEENPELQRAQQELGALKRELARIEGSSPSGADGGKRDSSRDSGLTNLGRLRDVKYYEFLYELLAKQYELAKIDEAKDSTIIQVLDTAVPPDRKSKPKRTLIVLFVAFAALLLAIFIVFIRELRAKVRADPEQASRLEALRKYLRWK